MGKIILLNTPIGNLGDLTPRVLDALRNGVLFAAEDTRVFKELLNHLGISLQGKKILSLHDQSSDSEVEKLIDLARGETLYVASEAGSPIVSDPAYPLIIKACEEGFEIDSYSGVSSVIMALELSGLPPIPFTFHGFLPREQGKKVNLFSNLNFGTHIFFEAPTRIEDTLDLLALNFPDFHLSLVRELSKKFQQVLRFKSSDWKVAREQLTVKGEFILLIHQSKVIQGHKQLKEQAQEILDRGASPKQLAKLLSEILERPTKELYSILSRQNKGADD